MQNEYDLSAPSPRSAAWFLGSFAVFFVVITWLVLRATSMSLRDMFSLPWVQVLAFVSGLIAAAGSIAVSRIWGKPDRIRAQLGSDTLSAYRVDEGRQETLVKQIALSDIEKVWFPASGNMLILKRRRQTLLEFGYSLFDASTRGDFDRFARDLREHLGIQESQRRSVWWRPGLGGVEYPSPLFQWRDIPVQALPPTRSGKFLLSWILANAFGFLSGVIAGAFATITVFGIWVVLSGDTNAGMGASASDAEAITSIAVGALVTGLIIGLFQRRVLSRRTGLRGEWTVATSLGAVGAWLTLAGALTMGIEQSLSTAELPRDDTLLTLATGAVIGTIWGGAQWLALRKHVARAGLWIPLNAGSTAVAISVGNQLNLIAPWVGDGQQSLLRVLSAAVGFFVGAILWSLLTGIALLRLLRPWQ